MGAEVSFDMVPVKVPEVHTKYRDICTEIPVADSMPIIEQLRKYEPISMSGQPLVVWDKAIGCNVYDIYGNKWIDFSSGVLVTNTGHGNQAVRDAIIEVTQHGLLTNYCFPSERRARLVKIISDIAPEPLKKVFLLSTGAETTECAIKLMKTYAVRKYGEKRCKVITFNDGFHGRTLGSLMAGGTPSARKWVVNGDKTFVQVPYPNAFKYEWADEKAPGYSDEKCWNKFLEYVKETGTEIDEIAGIMAESFQGGWVQLMPKGFVKRLREFCTEHDIILTFDEVQAGFGRSGKLFAFQHYDDVVPDIATCGKGISSSLPLSAVIGREDIMNLYGPNQMTSTHTGNPVSCAAAYANIKYMMDNKVIEHAAEMEPVVREFMDRLQKKYPDNIGVINGVGLAWGVVFTKPGTKEMDIMLAHNVVLHSVEKGLLFFAPVGDGSTIKVTPPPVIEKDMLLEGLSVFEEAIEQSVQEAKG